MKFVSNRVQARHVQQGTRIPESELVTYREAVFRGLAPDGGLYIPVDEPDMRDLFLSLSSQTTFLDIAARMSNALLGNELGLEVADRITTTAFDFSPKLNQLSDDIALLELFHGPSCAFKDFGASFLAASMSEMLSREDTRAVVLTATSGDTGSAVAHAFKDKQNIDVVILYPSGRVSPLQEKQLTTTGGNVHALEVDGSFDDCQRMVKTAFQDASLSRDVRLTSANSINLGRLLPQSFYYVYAFSRLKAAQRDKLIFCVPSGNFGNLTAGVYAWRWGLPITGFLAATNRNDVVPEYLESGVFQPRASVRTPSNAMDVGNPSNFDRLQSLFPDHQGMGTVIHGYAVSDEETIATMRRYYDERGVFIDPHTATGLFASEQTSVADVRDAGLTVVLATAHPAKFVEVVQQATGRKPAIPARLREAMHKPKVATQIAADDAELAEFLRGL